MSFGNDLLKYGYQCGVPKEKSITINKEDIEHLSSLWDTEARDIIEKINNCKGSIIISQENLRLLLNKLYETREDLDHAIENNYGDEL